jgi:choline transport protein
VYSARYTLLSHLVTYLPADLFTNPPQVSDRTSIPVYAVAFTSLVASILALINIGSTTAFNGVISVSIAGLFSSYLLTSSLLLYRRCTGGIVVSNAAHATDTTTTPDGMVRATWGPWRIRGALGIANNAFACVYLLFVFFFSFWPSYADVTPDNMNWSILVTGAIALLSAVYYLVWARKTYHGPVVEVEPQYVQDLSRSARRDAEVGSAI